MHALRFSLVAVATFAAASGLTGCFYEWQVAPGGGGGGGGSANGGAGGDAGGDGGLGGGGAGGTGGTGGCSPCPIVLADDQDAPRAIAVADGYAYWANTAGGAIRSALWRVPTEGGEPEPIASGVGNSLAIALDATHVYMTEHQTNGRLLRVPRDGGTPATLVATTDALVGVAVDATGVYFGASSGEIRKWDPIDDSTTTLGFAGSNAGLMVLAGGYVYGARLEQGGGIWRIPVGGGSVEVVGPETAGTAGLATDGTIIAYTVFDADEPEAGAVRRIGLGGENSFTIATGQGQPAEIALGLGGAYWANAYDGTIVRGELAAGGPTVIAEGQASPNGIAVDETSVYWTNNVASGQVMKLVVE